MFDVYYTGDPEEAKKYFFIKEFPEVMPMAVIIDPADREEINKNKEWEKSYPKKYRHLIFPNKLEKGFKKLIEEYLDEKAKHFHTSMKMAHDTRVTKISSDNFEKVILQD